MDYAGFLKAVERGQTPPVALLHGPDPFLLEDAVTRVTRALFPDGLDPSLLRETFDTKDAGAESIVRSALTLPWGSTRRLVVVKGLEGIGAKQGEALAAYLRSPNPSTVLLLLAAQSLASSHWLMNAMPTACIVPVPPPAGRQLVGWLRSRARTDGFELDEDAAGLLVELSGNDLAFEDGIRLRDGDDLESSPVGEGVDHGGRDDIFDGRLLGEILEDRDGDGLHVRRQVPANRVAATAGEQAEQDGSHARRPTTSHCRRPLAWAHVSPASRCSRGGRGPRPPSRPGAR